MTKSNRSILASKGFALSNAQPKAAKPVIDAEIVSAKPAETVKHSIEKFGEAALKAVREGKIHATETKTADGKEFSFKADFGRGENEYILSKETVKGKNETTKRELFVVQNGVRKPIQFGQFKRKYLYALSYRLENGYKNVKAWEKNDKKFMTELMKDMRANHAAYKKDGNKIVGKCKDQIIDLEYNIIKNKAGKNIKKIVLKADGSVKAQGCTCTKLLNAFNSPYKVRSKADPSAKAKIADESVKDLIG